MQRPHLPTCIRLVLVDLCELLLCLCHLFLKRTDLRLRVSGRVEQQVTRIALSESAKRNTLLAALAVWSMSARGRPGIGVERT